MRKSGGRCKSNDLITSAVVSLVSQLTPLACLFSFPPLLFQQEIFQERVVNSSLQRKTNFEEENNSLYIPAFYANVMYLKNADLVSNVQSIVVRCELHVRLLLSIRSNKQLYFN